MQNRNPVPAGPTPPREPRSVDLIVDRIRSRMSAFTGRFGSLGSRSRRLNSRLADLPWRIVIGSMLAALPISMLALFAGGWDVAMVALAAYLADWVGGFSALLIGFLLLDVLFVDERTGFAKPTNQDDRVALVLF